MVTKMQIPENAARIRAGIDIGSTETRGVIEAVDAEGKVLTTHTIVVPSDVGIVNKDDLAARMAVKGAKTLKSIYNVPTIAGDEIPTYRKSVSVAYPAKAGAITSDSFVALERVLDDAFDPVVKFKKAIWTGIGVPTEYTQNEYRSIVLGKILPRVINRNGEIDNRDITASEAFFEACALRAMAKAATIFDDLDLGRLCIVSTGGGTKNWYIADGAAPHEGNAFSDSFAGRELAARFRKYVLEENKDAKMDIGYAEKIVCGKLGKVNGKDYSQVRATLSGFKKPDQVPPMMAPIDIDGVYRERNIGPALDRAVRELFESEYTGTVGLLNRYEGEVKPVTFVHTGRAGQIKGLDTALEEGLVTAGFKDAKVYNLGKFVTAAGKELFVPNLLVAQGALEAVKEAESDPNFKWHYLMPK